MNKHLEPENTRSVALIDALDRIIKALNRSDVVVAWDAHAFADDATSHLIAQWVRMVLAKPSQHTALAYFRAILPILQQFGADSDSPLRWGHDVIGHIQTHARNPRTARLRLAVCRSLIGFCARITSEPATCWRRWQSAKPVLRMTNTELVTQQQIEATMIRARKAHDGDAVCIAIALAAFWGLRAGELATLCVGDVIMFGENITVVAHGKRRKTREVPSIRVPGPVFQTIHEWWWRRLDCGLTTSFIGLSERTLRLRVARLLRRATSSTWVSLHDLRHFYANRLLDEGMAVADIARVLGHNSPQTTVGSYVHFRPKFSPEQRIAHASQNHRVSNTVVAGWVGLTPTGQ